MSGYLIGYFLLTMHFFSLQLAHDLDWVFHMAKVNCLSWAPDSVHLASGSLDTAIIVWDAKNPSKHITLKSNLLFFSPLVCFSLSLFLSSASLSLSLFPPFSKISSYLNPC